MMHNKQSSFCLRFFMLPAALLFLFCTKDPVSSQSGQIAITAADPGVVEAWLTVETKETSSEQQIVIWRDGR